MVHCAKLLPAKIPFSITERQSSSSKITHVKAATHPSNAPRCIALTRRWLKALRLCTRQVECGHVVAKTNVDHAIDHCWRGGGISHGGVPQFDARLSIQRILTKVD